MIPGKSYLYRQHQDYALTPQTSDNMDPMPPPKAKPALKLKFGNQNGASAGKPASQPPTPSSQTPVRTPSLTLKFGKKPAGNASTPATPIDDGATANGSAKKRKRTDSVADPDGRPELKRPPTVLKLFTKNNPITTKSMAPTPGIKLKTKGKIPRRPQGVGYDSELEERENDPVLLEGLVIRMQPGEDCDYIRDSIANGTVGISILMNGADIRLRFLDVNGRRGILNVRGRQYAFTVVDLPTITEGMKSWDKKNFIKSIDISQLLLVLGRCSSDEEARNFPLPADVNPKNYKYAHGLTAPMRNVRKRRFERTARARLDDIEAIERKVAQILEADDRSSEVKWEVLDYDPRQEDEYSESESDAEGEEDDEGYFPAHIEPTEHTAEDLSALEAMLEEQMDDVLDSGATTTQPATDVNSSAPSPMHMDDVPTPADADADDDGDDDDDDENAEASDQEASDEKEETLAKIREAEEKIAQQKEQLRKTANSIIRKKIAKKIQALESDVKMMKRHAGIRDDDGDADGEDGGQDHMGAPASAPRQEDSGSEEE